ncbi:PEP-CTERM sorting domain-containing protein [Haloferula sp.]|uniref:PEP-CTERM sorting domain-containing protein n=1 Tax=Haloferula sp. TaxID=2497595 RepID=UPI00329BBF6B
MKKCILPLLAGILGTSLSQGAILFSELDITNNKIELVNTGGSAVDMSGWWWCDLAGGGTAYAQMTAVSMVDSGLSSVGASISNFGAGQILVLDIGENFLEDGFGELGLYNAASFSSPSAMEDYASWGGNGVRDSVAASKGIWVDNNPIDISGLGVGDTVQLSPGEDGNSASAYLIGGGTLGGSNIPEPTVGLLSLIGLGFLARRRRA